LNDDVIRVSRRAWLAGCLAAGCGKSERRAAVELPASTLASSASARSDGGPDAPRRATPLETTFPELARRLPRVELGRFPSALQDEPALALALGAPRLFVKRDDLASDVFGGGKLRKLERLLGEALAAKHETIVTFGGAGSNQAVATARFGAKLGLKVILYLAPQVAGPHVRAALFAMQRAGAELRFTASVSAAEAEVATWSKSGRRAYVIPPGGSSPLGDLAFVEAGLELAADLVAVRATDPISVYVACGTGGTAAGLAVGLRLARSPARVVAVRASSPGTSSRARLDALIGAVVAHARSLDASFPAIAPADVALVIDGSELGSGYGSPTPAGREMIARARDAAGILLEPVYTGKALAALAARTPARRDETLVFWATQHGGALEDEGDASALPAALRPYAQK
jgi:D-cysteine desulfhydrase